MSVAQEFHTYALVPPTNLFRAKLQPAFRLVAMVLWRWTSPRSKDAPERRFVWPSIEKILEYMPEGTCKRTVEKALTWLEGDGWITWGEGVDLHGRLRDGWHLHYEAKLAEAPETVLRHDDCRQADEPVQIPLFSYAELTGESVTDEHVTDDRQERPCSPLEEPAVTVEITDPKPAPAARVPSRAAELPPGDVAANRPEPCGESAGALRPVNRCAVATSDGAVVSSADQPPASGHDQTILDQSDQERRAGEGRAASPTRSGRAALDVETDVRVPQALPSPGFARAGFVRAGSVLATAGGSEIMAELRALPPETLRLLGLTEVAADLGLIASSG